MIAVIIPVYNRPQEAADILESLTRQTFKDFRVIIVEDGSKDDCREVVEGFRPLLDVKYLKKNNGGPALARNFGAAHTDAGFLVFLDSDCILPEGYMEAVARAVREGTEFFGGPDMAHPSFSPIQKAVSYAMTSFFTTGGIRGGKRKLDRFIPRSFNMGVSHKLFDSAGGFSDMRFGEDIDLSMKVIATGAKARLLPDAGVWHKRRTNMRSFFRQVYHSGVARVNLSMRHKGSLKAVHLLPSLFVVGSLACLAAIPFWPWAAIPLAAIVLTWFMDAAIRNRSLKVGALSVAASFVQLYGYGTGFFSGLWQRIVLGRTEKEANRTDFF